MTTSGVYALLIYSSRPPDAPPHPDGDQAVLERHRALQAEAGARGELLAVARLDASTGGPSACMRGGALEMIDGPYIETKEWLAGFYLLECADEQAALARARQICARDDTRIEVRAVAWHRLG